jgi:hypothetical protein
MADETSRKERAASMFDLRRVIGGLFILYGVILTITGAVASDADIHKAAGVNINLWTGLGMLAFGASFIAWFALRPLRLEEVAEPEEELEQDAARSEEARRRSRFDPERSRREVGAGREQS